MQQQNKNNLMGFDTTEINLVWLLIWWSSARKSWFDWTDWDWQVLDRVWVGGVKTKVKLVDLTPFWYILLNIFQLFNKTDCLLQILMTEGKTLPIQNVINVT